MVEQQQKLVLSPYMEIYDLVIPKDNLLRQIKELVDFGFVYDELIEKYCLDNGRNAIPPIRMFKYLLLKSIYDLSDVDVVERSKYDMSFKYFLDMAPEEKVINPSSLTKFRKLRLKDMNLLDLLISKTVQLALEKGIIKSNSIIVDATHTKSRYNQKTPRQALQEQSKKLRRSVYEVDESMRENFPAKNTEDSLEKELGYCKELIDAIKKNKTICSYPKVQEKMNLLEESVSDNFEHLETSKDEDAKTGHKTADTSFFGYKTHIAMTEERIITAATITSGEKTDGKELPALVRKSRDAGMEVESVIGDKAYSDKKNIEAAKDGGYELIARLNSIVTQGNRGKEEEFEFHKDAGMYQCKAGHLAVHKYLDRRQKEKKNKNPRMVYFFDVEKCKCCPYKEGCYKEGAKKKTYSETLICDEHSEQAKFQGTEHFKEKMKERYKIEAKNSELKHRHGYDVASSSGLIGMEMQGAIYTGGKNDTVLVRPLVIQLDNESIAGHENTWMWDVIEILEQQFDKENLRGFSVHRDETNVHMHVAFVPCYESEKNGKKKCVISQTKFFKNPKQLAGIHKTIRKSLIDKGYEIELDNKPIDEMLAGYTDQAGVFHQQGLTPEQLKKLTEKEIKLKIGEIEMNIRKSEMDKLEMAVADVMAKAKAGQQEIEKEREILSVQQTALDNDRATVQAQTQALIAEKASIEKTKEEVYSLAEICNQILSDEKNLNAKFLEFLERESKRTGKPFQKIVEDLYKRFQEDRRNSVSDWQMEMHNMRNERYRGVCQEKCVSFIKFSYRQFSKLPVLHGRINTVHI